MQIGGDQVVPQASACLAEQCVFLSVGFIQAAGEGKGISGHIVIDAHVYHKSSGDQQDPQSRAPASAGSLPDGISFPGRGSSLREEFNEHRRQQSQSFHAGKGS